MIEKIQDFIESNTSLDITKKQITLGLIGLGALIILIILFFVKSAGGVKPDPKGYTPPKPTFDDPVHIQGQ